MATGLCPWVAMPATSTTTVRIAANKKASGSHRRTTPENTPARIRITSLSSLA